jgi:predicted acylesterase/phospholipase RssA
MSNGSVSEMEKTNALKAEIKRALVLAGGGAKGAYAFGCLEAFKCHDIHFDAVAGTSVGALNALVWASDSLPQGKKIWEHLSFENVYPVRFPKYLHRYVIRTLAISYVILQSLWATLHGLPTRHPKILSASAVLLAFILPLPVMVTLALVFPGKPLPAAPRHVDSPYIVAACVAFVLGMMATAYFALRSRQTGGLYLFWSFVGMFWFLLLFIPLSYLKERLMPDFGQFGEMFYELLGVLIGLASGWAIYLGVARALRPDRSILTSTPLRNHLRNIVETQKPLTPCFVTIARRYQAFDPDKARWRTSDLDGSGAPRVYAEWEPDLETLWVPDYKRLDEIQATDKEKAADICLASAALPFGIVPPVRLDKVDYVDGGVVDNCPLFPFVEEMAAEEVFVVLLDSFSNRKSAIAAADLTSERWSQLKRLREVADFHIPFSQLASPDLRENLPYCVVNKPPKVIPFREPEHFPKIVLFYPEKPTGGFFKGVLRFEAGYAIDLINQGREETCRRLEELGHHSHAAHCEHSPRNRSCPPTP